MCNKVHETPFNFLCMDFAPKSEHMKFRSGFDEYIHIASEKEKEKENVSKRVKKMSRTGVLSDAAVMQHCMKYQAIPMKVADSILKQDAHTPFGSKKLKHPRHMNRPKI